MALTTDTHQYALELNLFNFHTTQTALRLHEADELVTVSNKQRKRTELLNLLKHFLSKSYTKHR